MISIQDLTKNSVVFARLIEEYGNDQDKEEDEIQNEKKPTNDSEKAEGPGNQKKAADLMQVEERNIGAVTWSVYKSYLTFAGGIIWGPTVILLMVLMQGSQGEHELKNLGERDLINPICFSVANNLILGFWTSKSVPGFTQGDYMGLYAGFGAASAVFMFLLSYAFTYVSSLCRFLFVDTFS